jgi:hypothetical protein
MTYDQFKKIISYDDICNKYYSEIKFEYFLETGTANAESTISMSPYFKNIISIEIAKHRYLKCLEKTKNIKNIKLHLGDSANLLEDILKNINENIVFWLDAHYSPLSDSGKGNKDCPLIEELSVISKRSNDDIIIIDDYSIFGTNGCIGANWEDIVVDKILGLFNEKRILRHFVIDDMFCLFIKK